MVFYGWLTLEVERPSQNIRKVKAKKLLPEFPEFRLHVNMHLIEISPALHLSVTSITCGIQDSDLLAALWLCDLLVLDVR